MISKGQNFGATTLSMTTFITMTLSMTTLITTMNKKRHSAIDSQHNAKHCNTECQIKALYAECHPAECRYAECRGVKFSTYI